MFIRKTVLKKLAVAWTILLIILTADSLSWKAQAANIVADIRTIYDVPADLSGKTIILHSNDVHGAIECYAKMAALRKAYEAAGRGIISRISSVAAIVV